MFKLEINKKALEDVIFKTLYNKYKFLEDLESLMQKSNHLGHLDSTVKYLRQEFSDMNIDTENVLNEVLENLNLSLDSEMDLDDYDKLENEISDYFSYKYMIKSLLSDDITDLSVANLQQIVCNKLNDFISMYNVSNGDYPLHHVPLENESILNCIGNSTYFSEFTANYVSADSLEDDLDYKCKLAGFINILSLNLISNTEIVAVLQLTKLDSLIKKSYPLSNFENFKLLKEDIITVIVKELHVENTILADSTYLTQTLQELFESDEDLVELINILRDKLQQHSKIVLQTFNLNSLRLNNTEKKTVLCHLITFVIEKQPNIELTKQINELKDSIEAFSNLETSEFVAILYSDSAHFLNILTDVYAIKLNKYYGIKKSEMVNFTEELKTNPSTTTNFTNLQAKFDSNINPSIKNLVSEYKDFVNNLNDDYTVQGLALSDVRTLKEVYTVNYGLLEDFIKYKVFKIEYLDYIVNKRVNYSEEFKIALYRGLLNKFIDTSMYSEYFKYYLKMNTHFILKFIEENPTVYFNLSNVSFDFDTFMTDSVAIFDGLDENNVVKIPPNLETLLQIIHNIPIPLNTFVIDMFNGEDFIVNDTEYLYMFNDLLINLYDANSYDDSWSKVDGLNIYNKLFNYKSKASWELNVFTTNTLGLITSLDESYSKYVHLLSSSLYSDTSSKDSQIGDSLVQILGLVNNPAKRLCMFTIEDSLNKLKYNRTFKDIHQKLVSKVIQKVESENTVKIFQEIDHIQFADKLYNNLELLFDLLKIVLNTAKKDLRLDADCLIEYNKITNKYIECFVKQLNNDSVGFLDAISEDESYVMLESSLSVKFSKFESINTCVDTYKIALMYSNIVEEILEYQPNIIKEVCKTRFYTNDNHEIKSNVIGLSKIYKNDGIVSIINRHLGEAFNEHIEYPSIINLSEQVSETADVSVTSNSLSDIDKNKLKNLINYIITKDDFIISKKFYDQKLTNISFILETYCNYCINRLNPTIILKIISSFDDSFVIKDISKFKKSIRTLKSKLNDF